MLSNQRSIASITLLVAFVVLVIVRLPNERSRIEQDEVLSYQDDRFLLHREFEPEFVNEEEYIQYLAKKLSPQDLVTWEDNANGKTTLQMHQFLHLHHMKTGGTSMDGLINCATRRLREDANEAIAYMNVQECGLSRYRKCRDGENSLCLDQINRSAILSYCAPLMDLEAFGWKASDDLLDLNKTLSFAPESNDTHIFNSKPRAVTVLRHPVHRVWSMFRFRTKACYKCTPLIDVYAAIDAGNISDITTDEICIAQLLDHQTRNLLSYPDGANLTKSEMLEDATYNLKNFFTMVGLTEEMNDTATMVGKVFPWMNETIPGSNSSCPLKHRNASPRNNRCGEDGGHWDLPSEPDNETRAAIEKHNALDIKLYEEAVQQFHYQKLALEIEVSESE